MGNFLHGFHYMRKALSVRKDCAFGNCAVCGCGVGVWVTRACFCCRGTGPLVHRVSLCPRASGPPRTARVRWPERSPRYKLHLQTSIFASTKCSIHWVMGKGSRLLDVLMWFTWTRREILQKHTLLTHRKTKSHKSWRFPVSFPLLNSSKLLCYPRIVNSESSRGPAGNLEDWSNWTKHTPLFSSTNK